MSRWPGRAWGALWEVKELRRMVGAGSGRVIMFFNLFILSGYYNYTHYLCSISQLITLAAFWSGGKTG